ncbi:hypothetical protein ACFE04_016502 [Oxalis oulophora]
MAQQTKTQLNNGGNFTSHSAASPLFAQRRRRLQQLQQQQQLDQNNLTMFHDFLGMKPTTTNDFPSKIPTPGDVTAPPATADSTSVSVGWSSGGGRGPISTTSDLGSVERQVVSHLEGVPYYGPRSDISGAELSKKFAGTKRSNSDCTFSQMGPDPLENLHYLKMLRSGTVGDRPKRPHDDDVLLNVRPTSSLVIHPPGGNRIDPNANKWERAITMNNAQAMHHYPPRGGQFTPFVHQVPHNRFRDTNAGPSIISQSAADEGSRTGMKGPGILSSLAGSSGVAEKNVTGLLPSSGKPRPGMTNNEPESSTPPSRQGSTSMSRQMTIFYGGQAHVFDDVHPNKADVIMALAGSNGGSWSTTFSPKSTAKAGGETQMPSGGEYDTGVAGNTTIPREFRGRLSAIGNIGQGVGSSDRVSTPIGAYQGGVNIIGKDARYPIQAGEARRSTEEKRDV